MSTSSFIDWASLAVCLVALGGLAGAGAWARNLALDLRRCVRIGGAGGLGVFGLVALAGLFGNVEATALVPWAALPLGAALVALVTMLGHAQPRARRLSARAAGAALAAGVVEVIALAPVLQLLLLYAGAGVALALPLAALAERYRGGPWPTRWIPPGTLPWGGAALGAATAFEIALFGPVAVQGALLLWPLALGSVATVLPLLRGRPAATTRRFAAVRRQAQLALLWRELARTAPRPAPQLMFLALILGVGAGAVLVPATWGLGAGLILLGGFEVARLRARRRADERAELPTKPLFRGIIHAASFVLAIAVAAQLLSSGGLRELVFGVGAAVAFGMSALYHRYPWTERAEPITQKLDHSAIFVFIAATAVAVVPGTVRGQVVLWAVLVGALLGIAVRWWRKAPGWLPYAMYLPVAWLPLAAMFDLAREVGWVPTALLIGGGIVYSSGALFLWRRWPAPNARYFGYHELFHLATLIAAVLQWVAIWYWILPARAAAAAALASVIP